MIIKEALLQEEINKIKKFLNTFDLKMDNSITKTFYVENIEGNIIGTISCDNNIIKCLAINQNMQNENIASLLVDEVLNYFRMNNIHNYLVFTKLIYKNIFLSLGFKEIIATDKVVLLEGGVYSIYDKIEEIKNIIIHRFGEVNENSDIGCIVINGNPITNGHIHLIEEASKKHKMVILFVVEENKSEFSFEERLSMAYISTFRLHNVCVIPSSQYIVSSKTFPSYFLKDEDVDIEYSKIDGLIFEKYFIKNLFIKKRYVGTEFSNKMVVYNNTLKEILKEKLEIINRFEINGEVISASKVRKLLKEQKFEEALQYVPRETGSLLINIARQKYGYS